jgi:predicted acetyltransferase
VTDFTVRPLVESELRAAHDVFRGSLHSGPQTDEKWQYVSAIYEPSRTFGAFAGDALVGATMSFPSSLALPGGSGPPMAAVTGVGVRADYRRRGILTELMRVQLMAAASTGEMFATLHASEGAIYGRFGYGVSTIARTIKVNVRRARLRPDLPRGGEVRLLDADEALSLLPKVYDRICGHRPGMIGRSPGWWSMAYERRLRTDDIALIAAHTGPDGVDGFATYTPQPDYRGPAASDEATLQLLDLQAGTAAAANDLWRFLLGIDLVDKVVGYLRPMDEPVEAMLVDRYVVGSDLDDELWVRIIDVPAALAARPYGDAEPVVLEVRDSLLPNNSGRYRVGPQGTEQTDSPADLLMDPDTLAMIYLGSTRPSVLAGIGRLEASDPAALVRADRLFATDLPAWCGTMF